MLAKSHSFDVRDWRMFAGERVAILGSGGYAFTLAAELRKLCAEPMLFSTDEEVPVGCFPLNDLENKGVYTIILGSSIYQANMILRLARKYPNLPLEIIDISDSFLGTGSNCKLLSQSPLSPKKPFILLADPFAQVHLDSHLSLLSKFYEKIGFDIIPVHPLKDLDYLIESRYCCGALLWNGTTPFFKSLIDQLTLFKKKYFFLELGMFPQSDWFFIDSDGVNVRRSLARDDLSWLNDYDFDFLDDVRGQFFGNVLLEPRYPQYVIVPLQLPYDTNVKLHSRFINGMQEFIDYIEDFHRGEQILIKPHPLDQNAKYYHTQSATITNDPWLSLLPKAKVVHGINSTTLFEAELYGKLSVLSEGDSLLTRHKNNVRQILAAITATQISRFSENPGLTMKRFCLLF